MQPRGGQAVALRFAVGTLGSALAGLIAFRQGIFNVSSPAFQCIPVGALGAMIFALIRTARPVPAVRLVGAFALLLFGVSWNTGGFEALAMALWSVFIGLGLCVVAVIYDQLARLNVRLGKFLIVGPLLGGVYFAAAPLASLGAGAPQGAMRSLWLHGFLGIVIGDGLGAAIEILELFIGPDETARTEIGDDRIQDPS